MEKQKQIHGHGIVIQCQRCGRALEIKGKITDYVSGKPTGCTVCNTSVDWWSTVCRNMQDDTMLHHPRVFYFLGANVRSFNVPLKVGQSTTCRFSDYGIPADARTLFVRYFPSPSHGLGFFSAEYRGTITTSKFFTNEVVLYPVVIGSGELPSDAEAHVMVGWVPQTADDESWQSLVDATESYVDRHYSDMIIPANVAVESALSRLMTSYLERFASKKHVANFLDNAATYSHQLNVILPVISSLKSIPVIPDQVRGTLNKLRDFRNDLAHSGALKQQLDRGTAAELLCGALFGFHYVRYVQQELLRN